MASVFGHVERTFWQYCFILPLCIAVEGRRLLRSCVMSPGNDASCLFLIIFETVEVGGKKRFPLDFHFPHHTTHTHRMVLRLPLIAEICNLCLMSSRFGHHHAMSGKKQYDVIVTKIR